jgi:hypothetical protein
MEKKRLKGPRWGRILRDWNQSLFVTSSFSIKHMLNETIIALKNTRRAHTIRFDFLFAGTAPCLWVINLRIHHFGARKFFLRGSVRSKWVQVASFLRLCQGSPSSFGGI